MEAVGYAKLLSGHTLSYSRKRIYRFIRHAVLRLVCFDTSMGIFLK